MNSHDIITLLILMVSEVTAFVCGVMLRWFYRRRRPHPGAPRGKRDMIYDTPTRNLSLKQWVVLTLSVWSCILFLPVLVTVLMKINYYPAGFSPANEIPTIILLLACIVALAFTWEAQRETKQEQCAGSAKNGVRRKGEDGTE